MKNNKHILKLQFQSSTYDKASNESIMIMNWLFYFLRNLPHGLYTADTDVCLFVKDLDKKSREFEVSEEHFSDMLVEKGVNCVRKVITSTEVYISGVWLSVISTLSTTVIRSVKRWIYVNWLTGLSVKKVRSQWFWLFIPWYTCKNW